MCNNAEELLERIKMYAEEILKNANLLNKHPSNYQYTDTITSLSYRIIKEIEEKLL